MHDSETNYRTLRLETTGDGRVGLLVLSRPERANAIDTTMARELLDVFVGLRDDQQSLRALVITGEGRAFCAGGDLKEREGMSDVAWRVQHELVENMIVAMLDCPVPVIAAVNGAAVGGGCEIAINCDFAYAVQGARFALTETSLGIFPGAGGTQNLPRAVGARRARELIFSARSFSAEEALGWGMINRVLPRDELLAAAIEIAQRIAANAPLAVAGAKQAINRGLDLPLRDGLAASADLYDQLVPTRDRREGIAAFAAKRPPSFEGR